VGRADISGSADLDRVENRGVGDPCGERRLRWLCSLGAGDLDGDGYVLGWWAGTVKWREVGARWGHTVHSQMPAPLSERELAVLALLPSLLSGAEIADELTCRSTT